MFRHVTSRQTRFNVRFIATKPSEYGQPTHYSHPHIIQKHETTPGIPAGDYEQRRRRLMDLLPDKSLVVAVSAPTKYMSKNIFYKYRQSSDFWYLTGFEEPKSAVILEKDSSPKGYKMSLFCSGTDSAQAKWDGASTSLSSAKTYFNADDTGSITEFPKRLKSLLPYASDVFVDLPDSTSSARKSPRSLLNYLSGVQPSAVEQDLAQQLESSRSFNRKPLGPVVDKLRAFKSEAELRVMRAAADISSNAHTKTMRFAEAGMSEQSIAAHFEYICALGGAQRPAYVPVVASGPNALILHYTSNNQIVESNELVLIDAGCEYNGYASDITRTFPISGQFSAAQRDVYTAVLTVQKEMIKLCTESSGLSLQELHHQSCKMLKEELNQIGFNLGREGDLERVLYPHYLGHPIGIDLHESTHFDRSAPLKKDMVITIEPGIYVPPSANFPKHFHNIGVRIEDEVLVGEEHPTILSVSAPKEVVDVEGACQGLLGLQPY